MKAGAFSDEGVFFFSRNAADPPFVRMVGRMQIKGGRICAIDKYSGWHSGD